MTQLERQIHIAQHRLWLNRWFHTVSVLVAVAAGIFAVVVLIQRLFDMPIPLFWIGIALAVGVAAGSVIWTIIGREDAAFAAAKLDEAAGLYERLSSGQYCVGENDPFAKAVVADAERVSGSLSARRHIRLTTPQPVTWSAASIIVAALMFLVSPGLLKPTEAKQADERAVELEQTKIAVKREMDAVQRMAETSPVLEDLKEQLDGGDRKLGGQLQRPSDIRHEAIKKIDKLADAVKQKRESDRYESTREMRKMLRGLKVPQSSNAPTQKLSKALQKSDFKTAKQEIQALREQLATLKSKEDRKMVAKISKQLDDISKQLEKIARNENLAQKLQQAGIEKEDVDRLLEHLKKEDLDQLKKQLEEKGMSQRQIEKLAKQLQQRQRAGAMAKTLAQSIKQGCRCNSPGQMGEALAGLAVAADQLGELELLEQEMNQLDTVLADLQSTRNGIGCRRYGPGCGENGPGAGMGKLGQGRGGLAPEQQTAVDFKTERGKVHTGKGAIIGQFLFDGEQVKGEVTSSINEVVSAAEHDASDRINRNRIPRQYHKAVKTYFSNVQRSIKDAKFTEPKATDGDSADESVDQTHDDEGKD